MAVVRFVARDGLVHVANPLPSSDATLCGLAYFMSAPTGRIVTCPSCAEVVSVCRGVKVAP